MSKAIQRDSGTGLSPSRLVPLLALFAAVHLVFVLLGYGCRFGDEQIATFWPSTGFALAVLLLLPRRIWPAVLLLMFVVETIVAGPRWADVSSVVACFANVVEAAVAASLIRWRLGPRSRHWSRSTGLGIVGAAVPATALGGMIAAAGVTLQFPEMSYRIVFTQWFFSDGVGLVLAAPLILTWADTTWIAGPLPKWRAVAEAAAFLLVTLFAAAFVFGAGWLPALSPLHQPYLIYPFFIWAALRLHPRVVTLGLLLTALVLVFNAQAGYGPFVTPGQMAKELVVSVQAFLAVMAVSTIILCAVVTDQKRSRADLRRTNRQLAESEERFRLAIEGVGEGAYDWNLETGDVHVSDRWLRSLGYTREEAPRLVSFWEDLLHPEDKPRVLQELEDHLAGRTERFESEYRLRMKSGKYRWTRDRGRVVSRNAAGKPLRIVGTEDDITYRKTAADKLAQMEHKLTHVARLSTLGELVAGIAHEVNQPLYAILNYAKACRNLLGQSDQPDLEMLRDWNEQISEAAVRGGAIIKRLREFVSRGQPQRSAVSANALVRETCQLLDFSLRKSGARVELDLAEPLPPVIVDTLQIQQVLVNLLQNACEAMEAVGNDDRRIVIRTGQLSDRVSVTVTDNGPGLPQDSGLNVFDSFVTTKPEGLGMGLAISRTIVEAHGGRLWAAGGQAGGAEFLFTLPTEADHDHDSD